MGHLAGRMNAGVGAAGAPQGAAQGVLESPQKAASARSIAACTEGWPACHCQPA